MPRQVSMTDNPEGKNMLQAYALQHPGKSLDCRSLADAEARESPRRRATAGFRFCRPSTWTQTWTTCDPAYHGVFPVSGIDWFAEA
jgi:hypothetical protein